MLFSNRMKGGVLFLILVLLPMADLLDKDQIRISSALKIA